MSITTPCDTASFSFTYTSSSVSYTVGASSIGTEYSMPTDTASSLYGNGYDTCGDRTHYLVDILGNKLYPTERD